MCIACMAHMSHFPQRCPIFNKQHGNRSSTRKQSTVWGCHSATPVNSVSQLSNKKSETIYDAPFEWPPPSYSQNAKSSQLKQHCSRWRVVVHRSVISREYLGWSAASGKCLQHGPSPLPGPFKPASSVSAASPSDRPKVGGVWLTPGDPPIRRRPFDRF